MTEYYYPINYYSVMWTIMRRKPCKVVIHQKPKVRGFNYTTIYMLSEPFNYYGDDHSIFAIKHIWQATSDGTAHKWTGKYDRVYTSRKPLKKMTLPFIQHVWGNYSIEVVDYYGKRKMQVTEVQTQEAARENL